MARQVNQNLYDLHDYSINIDKREIFLHSPYDNDGEINHVTAIKFEKNLSYLNHQNKKPILVHLHTDGGSWTDGLSIYDTIVSSLSPIAILAYSQAASMCSIILQSANTRVLMPNCTIMIHFGYLSLSDSQITLESNIDWAKKERFKMVEIYAQRCKNSPFFKDKSLSKIKSYITSKLRAKLDWYVDPEEAVQLGLADGILGDKSYPDINSLR